MLQVTDEQRWLIKYWLPALMSGGIAWLAYLFIGDTPLVRASGLALVIVGMTLALRRMGALLALLGGLTLAFCPAFWSQTGGGSDGPATIVIALAAAAVLTLLVALVGRRPTIALGLGVVIFVVLFWSQIGTPRSLRLTSFVTGWLLYLLIDMLMLTNPRPDDDVPRHPRPYHIPGILLLFTLGVLNDPLLTLLAPALMLSLFLARFRLAWWYWVVLLIATVIGLRGIGLTYLGTFSSLVDLSIWRDAPRWVDLMRFIIGQFSIIGGMLGVLGVARLARWYPPLGTVMMIGYGAYAFFALVYVGPNRDALLLPLLLIQVLWMTYAVFALSQWLLKSNQPYGHVMRAAALAGYGLIPLVMLWHIVQ